MWIPGKWLFRQYVGVNNPANHTQALNTATDNFLCLSSCLLS
ncbi:hypothetical protein M3J09_012190 [Ascochyta lentis]